MSTLLTEAVSDSSLLNSPSREISEAPPAKRPISTIVLPAAVVILISETREGFLSADLETICAAATRCGATILIATAGQPLEAREDAFKLWLRSSLDALRLSCKELDEFLSNDTAPELCTSFRNGTVDLLALDSAIHNERERKSREAAELLMAQKEKLKNALWSHAQGFVEHPVMPRYIVIRGDGELRLMKNLNQVKEWGRLGNHGYYSMELKGESIYRALPLPE